VPRRRCLLSLVPMDRGAQMPSLFKYANFEGKHSEFDSTVNSIPSDVPGMVLPSASVWG